MEGTAMLGSGIEKVEASNTVSGFRFPLNMSENFQTTLKQASHSLKHFLQGTFKIG
jgi:hypothetical protein